MRSGAHLLIAIILFCFVSVILECGKMASPVQQEPNIHRDLNYTRTKEHEAFMVSTEPNPNLKTIVSRMRLRACYCLCYSIPRKRVINQTCRYYDHLEKKQQLL